MVPDSEYIVSQPIASKQSSNWSFTQGLLIGQLSVIIVLSAFIRFFIFGEPPGDDHQPYRKSLLHSSSSTNSHRRRSHSKHSHQDSNDRLLRKKRSSLLRPSTPLSTNTILSKTYYNVNSHQPETLDWFNVLVAQTIAQFRDDARTDNAILTSLDNVLNGPNKPSFVDTIKVTEVNLGEDFPIFSNCRICPVESGAGTGGGKLQARMDVDLSDVITLGIETKLLLNYPKPLCAVLPVALAVSIVRFSGTLSISFVPSPSQPSTPPASTDSTSSPSPSQSTLHPTSSTPGNTPPQQQLTTLQFSFSDDYRLEISVRSLVGSRSRLQDVPKISQLVESRIHQWIDERCVEPRFQQIVLPSLWPRKKTTREGGQGAAGVGAGGGGSGGGMGAGGGESTGMNVGGPGGGDGLRNRNVMT